MKVLVAQLGARRHYLVPVALEKAGLLEQFVTDYYALGAVAGMSNLLPSGLKASVRARRSPDLPAARVSHFPMFAAVTQARAKVWAEPKHQSRRWIQSGSRFAAMASQHLTKDTTHVFAYTSAAKELFSKARSAGMACILDHATAPRRHEMGLVAEEYERFPGWATSAPTADHALDDYHARQLEEAAMADIVICNSTFAERALVAEGVPAATTRIVPLGLKMPADCRQRSRSARREHLHVLFVGAEGLRKGVPYLVHALERLSSKRIKARFVGALGFQQEGARRVQQVGDAIGHVPRVQMTQQWDWADVLVLPSVSDTFGLVILEAMVRGIPVIASENTGGPDVVRHCIDGFVVKVRDSDAIADRLEELASAASTLEAMSHSARERAASFSLEAYQSRLVSAITSAPRMAA